MRIKKEKRKRAASKDLFERLAKRNVRNSSRDYLIYFLTLAFSVALFYTFNSIDAQFTAFDIPDRLNFLAFSAGMLAAVSVLVCLIIGFLVVYANHFMLRRRKREMGIYMTLGMEFEDISALLWRETWIIGGVSLITGLASGILLSQGLSFMTAGIIGAEITNYRFVLSIKAVLMSVLFFGLLFFLVYRWNVRVIRKMELLELLYAGRKNETVSRGKRRDILLFVLGAVMLITGYAVTAAPDQKYFLQGLLGGIGFIAAGSILFCLSVSAVLVKIGRRRKKYYYSRLHLFAVNQLGSHLKSAGLSIGVVSILICLAISVMTIGLGAGKTFISDADAAAPYDVSFLMREKEETESLKHMTVELALKQKGLAISDYVKESAELRGYTLDAVTWDMFDGDGDLKQYQVYIVGAGDYNRMRALKGIAPLKLGENEYAVNYNVEGREKTLSDFMESGGTLDLNGNLLTPAENGLYRWTYMNGNGFADVGTFIVPQRLVKGLNLTWAVCNGSFRDADSYGKLTKAHIQIPERILFYTHQDIKIEIMSNILTVTYIGIYLGITFLIAAGAVLALQQLSQAADNQGSYALLRKFGADEAEMKEALLIQLLAYFGIPFVPAVLNTAFIVAGVFAGAEELSAWAVVQTGFLTGGAAIVVYGLYFIVTYAGSARIFMLTKRTRPEQ